MGGPPPPPSSLNGERWTPLINQRAEHTEDLGLLPSWGPGSSNPTGTPKSQSEGRERGAGRWGFRVQGTQWGPGRQPLGFHIPTRAGAVWCTPGPTEDSYGAGRSGTAGKCAGSGDGTAGQAHGPLGPHPEWRCARSADVSTGGEG